MPLGEMLAVSLEVGLRSIELVVVVEVDVLGLGIHPDVDAWDGGWELAEGVVHVLRHRAERIDKLRAVALDRGLDPRVVAERARAGGIVSTTQAKFQPDEVVHGRPHVRVIWRGGGLRNTPPPPPARGGAQKGGGGAGRPP